MQVITKDYAMKTLKSTNLSKSCTQNSHSSDEPSPPKDQPQPPWLRAEIAKGLALFLSAGVKPFGGSDIKSLTAVYSAIIFDAIGSPVAEIDTPRIRTAFRSAAKKCEKWPVPATIIALMPNRPHRQSLENSTVRDTYKVQLEGKEKIRQIISMLDKKT